VGTRRTSHPRFRREGEVPPIKLTDDDTAIIRCVFRHRFVRADDLYRLFSDRSPDRLSRRLTLLYRNQYLDRPGSQIDRFRKGGSQAYVYGLDSAGARLLKEKEGAPVGPTDWKSRNRTYTRENLDHTLAVAHFMIDLELACRARKDVSVIPFDEILAHAPEETKQSVYPARWPVQVRFNGANTTIHLIPDAIFGLRLARQGAKHLQSYIFLEIDRGTTTIAPAERVRESDAFVHRTSVLRKLITYAESWRQNLHKAQFNIPASRVLTLTTSAARATAMRISARDLVSKNFRLPEGLFLFGVLQQATNPLDMALEASSGQTTQLIPSR
jgi:hypothetical protein